MRLLETCLAHPDSYPLTIRSFHTADEVPYAILSHTWGHEELLYEDVVHKTGETKEGFAKILRAIRQARDDGHRYIWIDNVCINKASSAELQEAINSMFAWYSKAAICYAHLSDVKMQGSGPIPYKDIAASRWFKRGWSMCRIVGPCNTPSSLTYHIGNSITRADRPSSHQFLHHRLDLSWRQATFPQHTPHSHASQSPGAI